MKSKKAGWIKRNIKRMLTSALLILCLGSLGVYAKYFAQSAREGIAVASGVYFASNYLGEALEADDPFLETVVTRDYNGRNHTISLEIRNYENNLLFNEENMLIPYRLTLWLEDGSSVPANISYKVTYGEQGTTKNIPAGKANGVVIQGEQLKGGAASQNKYAVKIETEGGVVNTDPIPIYVMVETEAQSFVSKVLKGKLTVQTMAPVDFIESSGFLFPDLPEGAPDGDKVALAQKLPALTYEIRTVSEAMTSAEIVKKLKIGWRTDQLEINQFDSYYEAAMSEGSVEDKNGWRYMPVDAIPYSAMNMVFFKLNDFSTLPDTATLNSYVTVEEIKE